MKKARVFSIARADVIDYARDWSVRFEPNVDPQLPVRRDTMLVDPMTDGSADITHWVCVRRVPHDVVGRMQDVAESDGVDVTIMCLSLEEIRQRVEELSRMPWKVIVCDASRHEVFAALGLEVV